MYIHIYIYIYTYIYISHLCLTSKCVGHLLPCLKEEQLRTIPYNTLKRFKFQEIQVPVSTGLVVDGAATSQLTVSHVQKRYLFDSVTIPRIDEICDRLNNLNILYFVHSSSTVDLS